MSDIYMEPEGHPLGSAQDRDTAARACNHMDMQTARLHLIHQLLQCIAEG